MLHYVDEPTGGRTIMRVVFSFLFVVVLALGSALTHAATLQESYEARGWTYASALQVSVAGFDTAIKDQGNASLKMYFDCSDSSNWGIVYTTPDFPNESGTPQTTITLRVYLEPIGAAQGSPTFKLAVQGASEMAGNDTALTSNTWITVNIPATSLTGPFRQVKFIIGSNSGNASGQFNIYVDSLMRGNVLIDGCEPGFTAGNSLLVNTEGTAAGAASDIRHLVTNPVAVGPSDGAMAFAAQWTGDTNNTVEIQHNFAPTANLGGFLALSFDIYVPTGTALPTVGAFFWDGANGFFATPTATPTAHDAWQSLSIDISGISSAGGGFNNATVQQLKLVLQNAGVAGTVLVDNVQLTDTDPNALPAGTLQEAYEARGWTYANTLQVSVDGYTTAIRQQGQSALKLHYDCSDPSNWGIVYTTPDFPNESGTPQTTYTIQVYLEPIGAAQGNPNFKLALQGASEMSGGDTALTSNTWTTVIVPPASVTGAFRQVKFIIGSNSGNASGQFNLYVDTLKRGDTLIDGFEPGFAAGNIALVNTEGSAVGAPSDIRNLVTNPVTVGPAEGAMAFAAQWSGDTNDTVEIQHNFTPVVNLSDYTTATVNVYVPTGTALPTLAAFFWDGANGYLAPATVAPTAHDAWQTLSIDISGIGTAGGGFDATAVQQMKLVLQSAGAAGSVYVDNLRLYKPSSTVSAASHWEVYN
jgi:hypothetical protein